MKNGDLKFAEIDVDKAKLQLLLETESDTISKMDDKTFSHLMQNLEKLSQQYQKTAWMTWRRFNNVLIKPGI